MGFFGLAGQGVGVRQQSLGAVVAVLGILHYGTLEIRNGSSGVAEFHAANGTMVEGIGVISSRRNCLVVALAGASVLAIFPEEIGEFFVVPCRRIIEDGGLQF